MGRLRFFAAAAVLAASFRMSNSFAATWVYVGNADTQDLSLFQLSADGHLTPRGTVTVQSPAEPGRSMLIAVSPNKRFLYAAYLSGGSKSAVTTYSIDPNTGALTRTGNTALADGMAYISTDRSGRFLFSASYPGNKVTVNSILPSGNVGELRQVVDTEPNAHCILPDPSNHYVLHTSLGGDVIYQQKFDAAAGTLSPNNPPTARVDAKAGPRFLTFSADDRFVYVIDEYNAAVSVFPFDASQGRLQPREQVATALPPGFTGKAWGADIHVTPNGNYLYTSERTSSTLAAFRVDQRNGKLQPIASIPTVKQPRAFNIDPSGRFLLAAGQLSNTVMSYSIDQASGRLTALGEQAVGKNPTWVEIVRLP
jgi:6-phosphogluconolactonase